MAPGSCQLCSFALPPSLRLWSPSHCHHAPKNNRVENPRNVLSPEAWPQPRCPAGPRWAGGGGSVSTHIIALTQPLLLRPTPPAARTASCAEVQQMRLGSCPPPRQRPSSGASAKVRSLLAGRECQVGMAEAGPAECVHRPLVGWVLQGRQAGRRSSDTSRRCLVLQRLDAQRGGGSKRHPCRDCCCRRGQGGVWGTHPDGGWPKGGSSSVVGRPSPSPPGSGGGRGPLSAAPARPPEARAPPPLLAHRRDRRAGARRRVGHSRAGAVPPPDGSREVRAG